MSQYSGGIGYIPTTANGQLESRERSAATELLRKQMLGKRSFQKSSVSTTGKIESRHGGKPKTQSGKPQPKRARKEDSSDDEDGRSRLGKKERPSASARLSTTQHKAREEDYSKQQPASEKQKSVNTKRGSSYLDQVLAQRAAKKEKKPERRDA